MISPETLADPIYINGMPFIFDPEDVLTGTPNDDRLEGDRQKTIISGEGGNDRIIAGPLASRLSGDGGDDVVKGNLSGDRLTGGEGSDVLLGGDGNDVIYGDAGTDVLRGGEGDDVLFGGAERDRLVGGGGADGFALEFDAVGGDRIRDFEDGTDKLAIGGPDVYSFDSEDLEAFVNDLTIKQRGTSTVIQDDGQAIAVLANVEATSITLSDFAPIVVAM